MDFTLLHIIFVTEHDAEWECMENTADEDIDFGAQTEWVIVRLMGSQIRTGISQIAELSDFRWTRMQFDSGRNNTHTIRLCLYNFSRLLTPARGDIGIPSTTLQQATQVQPITSECSSTATHSLSTTTPSNTDRMKKSLCCDQLHRSPTIALNAHERGSTDVTEM